MEPLWGPKITSYQIDGKLLCVDGGEQGRAGADEGHFANILQQHIDETAARRPSRQTP
jgi:hypothetical protein